VTNQAPIKGLDPLLTLSEFAAVLRVPVRKARQFAKSGAVRSVRVGVNGFRFRPVDVSRFIESGATGYASARRTPHA
jgi:excisionase family DNA binding protein